MKNEKTFRAMVVEEADGHFVRKIRTRSTKDLPDGDVLIKVHFSSLNYKDALSASGNKGVTRKYPHTPGIDAAGIVVESKVADFEPGRKVLVTGYDLGMNTAGGFGQYIQVPAEWVVPLPEGLSLEESMMLGTAGFTAGIGVYKLRRAGLMPADGPVLVTGASGGVGSLAVAILSGLGYHVLAASGKPDAAGWLEQLGAAKVLTRRDVLDESPKPLLPKRWKGAIDTVGGPVLATVLRSTDRHGVVACCGNVASARLELTVYPFILRGISLLGIDSATSTMDLRLKVWHKLAGPWKPAGLDSMVTKIGLEQLDSTIDLMLRSGHTGRFLVQLD